jgi:hypothetical protein
VDENRKNGIKSCKNDSSELAFGKKYYSTTSKDPYIDVTKNGVKILVKSHNLKNDAKKQNDLKEIEIKSALIKKSDAKNKTKTTQKNNDNQACLFPYSNFLFTRLQDLFVTLNKMLSTVQECLNLVNSYM